MKTHLQIQAADFVRALVKEEFDKVADHAHPALVNGHGGREGYIKQLAEQANSSRTRSTSYDEPIALDDPVFDNDAAGTLFAFVPYRVTVRRPKQEGFGPTDYLVGVSMDQGQTWQFLDRLSFKGSEVRLRGLLPSLPADFKLPR